MLTFLNFKNEIQVLAKIFISKFPFDFFNNVLFICDANILCYAPIASSTAQELQLHLGVLQQHAALMIGGATATPCPICHKVVFGGEALVEHMKNTHKDPNASGVASKFAESDVRFLNLNLSRNRISIVCNVFLFFWNVFQKNNNSFPIELFFFFLKTFQI